MENMPSMDEWLKEAEEDLSAPDIGMYLFHIGKVRRTERAYVRGNAPTSREVTAMCFSYDQKLVDEAIKETYRMAGIRYVRVWLASGELSVGDDIMRVLVGGDIRPHVIDALQYLVGRIKNDCINEEELFAQAEQPE